MVAMAAELPDYLSSEANALELFNHHLVDVATTG